MKKYGWYLVAAMMSAGVMMWEAPMVSYAEPIAAQSAEASETEEDEEDTGDGIASPIVEVANEDEITDEENGPDLAIQAAAQAKAKAEEEARMAAEAAEAMNNRRKNLVSYALQFVGNPYRTGGNDPHTGADCSGFVKYVMQYGAGVSMNRSSSRQATQGTAISASQMQPGDLIFYGNGSRINHVAMYIGDGQIVHASTHRTGIKISNWNYRTPVKIISVLG